MDYQKPPNLMTDMQIENFLSPLGLGGIGRQTMFASRSKKTEKLSKIKEDAKRR
jgi:hypothetical protein